MIVAAIIVVQVARDTTASDFDYAHTLPSNGLPVLNTPTSLPPNIHSMVPCPFDTWVAISFTYKPSTELWKNL